MTPPDIEQREVRWKREDLRNADGGMYWFLDAAWPAFAGVRRGEDGVHFWSIQVGRVSKHGRAPSLDDALAAATEALGE